MLCDRCKKRPAIVHYTQIVNNTKQEMHLCEHCAREVQSETFGFIPQINFHNFLAGLINNEFGIGTIPKTQKDSITCPTCGTSEGQVAKKGLMGCSDCYATFENSIDPILKRIHGTTSHTGKFPERSGGKIRVKKQISMLKQQMQEAIGKEEFEKAAVLRDQIKELEKQELA